MVKGNLVKNEIEKIIRVMYIHSSAEYVQELSSALENDDNIKVEFKHFPNLTQGLAALEQDTPDVIMSELDLSDSLGVDTCVRIRHKTKVIPLLIINMQEDIELVKNVLRAGADMYLLPRMATYPAILYHLCSAVELSRRADALAETGTAPQLIDSSLLKPETSLNEGEKSDSDYTNVAERRSNSAVVQSEEELDMDVKQSRILVVDDDEIARDILKECLEKAEYIVEEASNGFEALVAIRSRYINKQPFSLVLLDLMMPEMNGYEFLHTIRQRRWGNFLPILVSTSKSNDDSVVRCRSYNISGYVLKPYEPDIVLEYVNKAITSARIIKAKRERRGSSWQDRS